MAVVDRISQPGIPANINSHRTMISTDTTLNTPQRIGCDKAAGQNLAAFSKWPGSMLNIHIAMNFSTILTPENMISLTVITSHDNLTKPDEEIL
jgi:hypothetical protein